MLIKISVKIVKTKKISGCLFVHFYFSTFIVYHLLFLREEILFFLEVDKSW